MPAKGLVVIFKSQGEMRVIPIVDDKLLRSPTKQRKALSKHVASSSSSRYLVLPIISTTSSHSYSQSTEKNCRSNDDGNISGPEGRPRLEYTHFGLHLISFPPLEGMFSF